MELNKRYIIDLSQAQSPADIVFELSNIIEKEDAANQKIWLKLGNVTLNQSQLLSINSLISSINSTLSLVESESQQTELAAATLGICTKDVEEELQEEFSQLEAKAPEDEPSLQYVPMTEHLDDSSDSADSAEKTQQEEAESKDAENTVDTTTDDNKETVDEQNSENDDADKETAPIKTENEPAEVQNQENNETTDEQKESGSLADVDIVFKKPAIDSENESDSSVVFSSENKEQKEEEIQEQLDSIFDSETKLENILSDDKDINEMKNWPLTKEAEDNFEIPEEEMTDEDYEILQMSTQYHKQTVRSGQVIKSNGNVVIIGDCHPGCEIHAAGDITVWGILGGIAHAGCNGNTKARIRALTLNAIQLRIADSYARRPDYIKNIYVEKSNTFTPEEARNINGSIVILKINDK